MAVSTRARSRRVSARLGDPLGELVAQLLQLAEVEDPRLGGHRGDAVLDLDPAEGLGEEAGELALEMADLAPQLGPGQALVDLDVERRSGCLLRADPASAWSRV